MADQFKIREETQEHLGQGKFIEYDGWNVIISQQRPNGTWEQVKLSPGLVNKVVDYINRMSDIYNR